VLEQFFLENGSQPERIHNFFSKALIPTMRRFHKGPAIFAEALTAPHMPQVLAILGISSVEEIFDVSSKLFADKDFSKAYEEWEAGEQPFLSASASLLQATDYSPEIAVPDKAPETRRILELRTYHSPTGRQLKALHERNSGPEIKIFHRVGVHPLFYSATVFGTMRPNLTYLIPFANLAEREGPVPCSVPCLTGSVHKRCGPITPESPRSGVTPAGIRFTGLSDSWRCWSDRGL
jgi:hypothetical protein